MFYHYADYVSSTKKQGKPGGGTNALQGPPNLCAVSRVLEASAPVEGGCRRRTSMSVSNKLKPSPYEMRPVKPDRMERSEFNVYRPERNPEHVAEIREATMSASRSLDTRRAGFGLGAERLEAYSHWRVPGEIYSESDRHAQLLAERSVDAGKTTKVTKIGAHAPGPAMGFNSKYLYRR